MAPELKLSFQFAGLSVADKKPPLFLRTSGVAGTFTAKGNLWNIDTVKLILKGSICNVIDSGTSTGFNNTSRVVLEQTVLNLSDVYKTSAALQTGDGSYYFPFNFQFQKRCHGSKAETPPADVSCDSTLPSSLAVGSLGSLNRIDDLTSTNGTGARVSYELQAWLFKGDTVKEAVSQDIRLYDSACHDPPPTITEHFPGEFLLKEKKKLRKRLFRDEGKMLICVGEPAAITTLRNHRIVQARVPIAMRISNRQTVPQALELRLKTTLQAVTSISSTTMGRSPNIKQSRDSSGISDVRTAAQSFTQVLSVPPDWQLDDQVGAGAWQQNLLVNVPLLLDQNPPPSFTSPYIARRYAIAMHIEARGRGRASFDLKVPVELLYEGDGSEILAPTRNFADGVGLPLSPSIADLLRAVRPDDDELPIYVR